MTQHVSEPITGEYEAINFDGLERRANYRTIAYREDILHVLERKDAAAIIYQIISRWETEIKRPQIIKEIERRRQTKQPSLTAQEVEDMMWIYMSYNDFVRESGGAVAYNTVIRMLDYMIHTKKVVEQRENHDPRYPDYEYRINKEVVKELLKALPAQPPFTPKVPKKKEKSTQEGIATSNSTHLGIPPYDSTQMGTQSTQEGIATTHLGTEVYPFGGTSHITHNYSHNYNTEHERIAHDLASTVASPIVDAARAEFNPFEQIPVTFNEALYYLEPHGGPPTDCGDAVEIIKLAQKLWVEAHENENRSQQGDDHALLDNPGLPAHLATVGDTRQFARQDLCQHPLQGQELDKTFPREAEIGDEETLHRVKAVSRKGQNDAIRYDASHPDQSFRPYRGLYSGKAREAEQALEQNTSPSTPARAELLSAPSSPKGNGWAPAQVPPDGTPAARAVSSPEQAAPGPARPTGHSAVSPGGTVVTPDVPPSGVSPQQQTLQAPDMSGPWSNEACVAYAEWCNKKRYTDKMREEQLKAAQTLHKNDASLTLEQYRQAYDERNDAWWQEHKGKLHVNDMKAKGTSGIPRVYEMLQRIEDAASKQHARAHLQVVPAPPANAFIARALDKEYNQRKLAEMRAQVALKQTQQIGV